MTIPKIIQFHLWIFLALLVGLGSKDSVKKICKAEWRNVNLKKKKQRAQI